MGAISRDIIAARAFEFLARALAVRMSLPGDDVLAWPSPQPPHVAKDGRHDAPLLAVTSQARQAIAAMPPRRYPDSHQHGGSKNAASRICLHHMLAIFHARRYRAAGRSAPLHMTPTLQSLPRPSIHIRVAASEFRRASRSTTYLPP